MDGDECGSRELHFLDGRDCNRQGYTEVKFIFKPKIFVRKMTHPSWHRSKTGVQLREKKKEKILKIIIIFGKWGKKKNSLFERESLVRRANVVRIPRSDSGVYLLTEIKKGKRSKWREKKARVTRSKACLVGSACIVFHFDAENDAAIHDGANFSFLEHRFIPRGEALNFSVFKVWKKKCKNRFKRIRI